MQDLLTTLRRLRAPDGCPWDREQTHESLRPYLLEEAAEAVDAVAGGPAALADELGDVLLQVAFHAVIAEEVGTFGYPDIERGIVDKLVRRHPHVFGSVTVEGSADVVRNWQAIKAAERAGRPRRAAERVPAALGALARETQTQRLAGQEQAGREAVAAALHAAPDTAAGVADVLAAVVAWARAAGVDPELALRDRTHATLAALPDPVPTAPGGPAEAGA
ncbi:MazG nucleotide pyrophosphohydrolase domain-containing protein [Deinococcus budaensis]|uniref:XTP/dITP diphosphohydrolase n=1 Tax=Deinococcus budaensis TaxID=1665626 RepID=A0A7W8LNW9_9DEIO|nr:MazG nucleotide pyrophosphohydrolase domain-containing protein [Deinococcus budaensis]MBB5233151.1 XTP/dITP diphosphohydrolase [Deinococcus budaensis]